jgi:putative copper export protein
VLGVSWDSVRLFLHILAATIWVGGQVVLAGLVPVLRGIGSDAPRLAAQRFNRIAWPAFAVLIATGVWNVVAEHRHDHGAYRTTLIVKLCLVAVSGLAAAFHIRAKTAGSRAALGAASAGAALAALFLGVLLAR